MSDEVARELYKLTDDEREVTLKALIWFMGSSGSDGEQDEIANRVANMLQYRVSS